MIGKLWRRLDQWEREWRNSFGKDITDPHERKRSEWHLDWLDHGILRRRWHNFAEIAPGAYRSNQPNPKRFAAYADMGIRTILNLRGRVRLSPYLFEIEACEKHGLTLVDVAMSARSAPRRESMLELLDAFETMERPFLMHCKSGADRTGLAAAIYLLAVENRPLAEARKQLSVRFVHFRRSKTGIMDHLLDLYERRLAKGPIGIADWLRDEYDQDTLTRSFQAYRDAGYRWPA
ncbi:MAG: protein tyrosine phosphatase [Limimaricola sp.]|uniref:phosphatase domain-containing putative toxin n=1 Tax=Limimaricola sp. TaxID=2211665 RepID=UPI001D3DD188|nr:tyrosine-protein phosphatase [Limimaricola sp.]MBI1417305.1 protein tyrosine phosphatase [Limimaricola sp.]